VTANAILNDTGEPDAYVPDAPQVPVQDLPEESLLFLLGSRYCETDGSPRRPGPSSDNGPTGWGRVQAICDYVHNHIVFGYEHARMTRTAFEAWHDRTGVCRDYAHLAVAFCRCMNIPARYCTGYLGDVGDAAAVRAAGLRRVVRGLPGRAVVHVRRAQQHAAASAAC
jgi:transglutaminase-like putative cysteine protease